MIAASRHETPPPARMGPWAVPRRPPTNASAQKFATPPPKAKTIRRPDRCRGARGQGPAGQGAGSAGAGQTVAPAEVKRFRRLWAKGVTRKQLAALFGVDDATIKHWRRKLALPPRPCGRPRQIDPAMAARFTAACRCNRNGHELAAEFGITRREAWRMRSILGLTRHRPHMNRTGAGQVAAAAARPGPEGAGPEGAGPKGAGPEGAPIALAQLGPAEDPSRCHPERISSCGFVIAGPPWRYCDAPTLNNRSMCELHRAGCVVVTRA